MHKVTALVLPAFSHSSGCRRITKEIIVSNLICPFQERDLNQALTYSLTIRSHSGILNSLSMKLYYCTQSNSHQYEESDPSNLTDFCSGKTFWHNFASVHSIEECWEEWMKAYCSRTPYTWQGAIQDKENLISTLDGGKRNQNSLGRWHLFIFSLLCNTFCFLIPFFSFPLFISKQQLLDSVQYTHS